jgi:hypothetical protein
MPSAFARYFDLLVSIEMLTLVQESPSTSTLPTAPCFIEMRPIPRDCWFVNYASVQLIRQWSVLGTQLRRPTGPLGGRDDKGLPSPQARRHSDSAAACRASLSERGAAEPCAGHGGGLGARHRSAAATGTAARQGRR